ncbi:restriction endonuclease [Streptomyces sp. NPDC004237]|uniref:restriction endonuclease n=1 Tax=Streptomyces sp. NPDC004237 TaxID=3154455 RepID=UPI0033A6B282
MAAMNGRTFERASRRQAADPRWVRQRRCAGGHGDRGVDIIGLTSDGRRLVVQCKRFAPYLNITSPEALSIAGEAGITAVHRGALEEWSAGESLRILE